MRLGNGAPAACKMKCVRMCVNLIALAVAGLWGAAETEHGNAKVTYDASTQIFRMDGGGISYIFGINETINCRPCIAETDWITSMFLLRHARRAAHRRLILR